jgi:hypothetical protein
MSGTASASPCPKAMSGPEASVQPLSGLRPKAWAIPKSRLLTWPRLVTKTFEGFQRRRADDLLEEGGQGAGLHARWPNAVLPSG